MHNLLGLEETLEGEYPLNFCSEDVFQLSCAFSHPPLGSQMASLYSAMMQVFILLSLQNLHASPFSPPVIFALKFVAHRNVARASTCDTCTP